MSRRIVPGLVIGSATLAVACAIAGLIPYERLQPLGGLVRRPDDVTPERYQRYLHVMWGGAGALGLLAGWLHRRRDAVEAFLRELVAPPVPCSDQHRAASTGTLDWLLPSAIVVAGAGLRMAQLGAPMAYDEAYTWLNFASRPWYEAIGDYNSTNNHLLNTLLVHVCGKLFGPQEWALRLPVFLGGTLLPAAVWVWGRDWLGRGVAAVAAALTAVAPALVSYSADARGYMYVALAAISLDASLGRLQRRSHARTWAAAWLALTLGLCAMPIMMYAAVASLGWFVLTPHGADDSPAGEHRWSQRLRSVLPLVALSALAVAAFYTPAYLFRGMQFLRDPIMQSASADRFLEEAARSWRAAAGWWTDGAIPSAVWIVAAACGVLFWPGARWGWLRWWAPFVVVSGLNAAQQVAPPPRILLHLAPWVYLLCGVGVEGLRRIVCRPSTESASGSISPAVATTAVVVILLAGGVESLRRPVQFFPEERTSYVSVPEVVDRLATELANRPGERHVLLAPLPCDLPAIFYLRRLGVETPVNVRPRPGDRVWIITRLGEGVDTVLSSPLVGCGDLISGFEPWRTIEEFRTLRLATAVLKSPAPAPTSINE